MISADFITWSVMVAFTGPKTLSITVLHITEHAELRPHRTEDK